jgi:hypothetical protein
MSSSLSLGSAPKRLGEGRNFRVMTSTRPLNISTAITVMISAGTTFMLSES